MSPILVVILVVVLIALIILQSYFTLGPGRHLTVGNPDHWWNKPISKNGRRVVGGLLALVFLGFLVFDLTHPRAFSIFGPTPLKDYFDGFWCAIGVLVATGVLPRRRRSDS